MPRRKGRKLAKQVYKNKRFLKKLAKGVENKCKKLADTDVDVNSTGATHCMSAMKQGTAGYGDGTSAGEELRVGEEINTKRITIKGHIHNDHGTPEDCIVRLLLFRCKNQNNVDQTLAALFGTGFLIDTLPYAPHSNRFQILFDKTFAMDTLGRTKVPFYWTGKVNTITRYNNNNGNSADIENNAYYLAFYSDVAGTTNDPYMDYHYHYWFEDA